MHQAIPVVSRFITIFIVRWDGLEFENEIYYLMEWLHISSFMELKQCVLNYLYDIFISGSIETKCKILQYLANLVVNIVSIKYIIIYYVSQYLIFIFLPDHNLF